MGIAIFLHPFLSGISQPMFDATARGRCFDVEIQAPDFIRAIRRPWAEQGSTGDPQ
jgi:hypothetical protein